MDDFLSLIGGGRSASFFVFAFVIRICKSSRMPPKSTNENLKSSPEDQLYTALCARRLVQAAIDTHGTYTSTAITMAVKRELGRSKDDPAVRAMAESIARRLENEGVTIVATIGKLLADGEDRSMRNKKNAKRSKELQAQRKAALKLDDDVSEDDAPEDNDEVDDDDVEFLGFSPSEPTKAKPGSEEKVLMLAARYRAGVGNLWHPDDEDDQGSKHDLESDPERRADRFTRAAQAQRDHLESLTVRST